MEFRPLTIFTGANSSGKSTVLQSILLIAQTLKSQRTSKSVVLNGCIKKFGTYMDLVNDCDIRKNISLGFEISNFGDMVRETPIRWNEELESIGCRLEFADNNADPLNPILVSLCMKTNGNSPENSLRIIRRDGQFSEKEQHVIDNCEKKISDSDLMYKMTEFKSGVVGMYGRNDMLQNMIGVNMSHFLPNYGIRYISLTERLEAVLDNFFGMGSSWGTIGAYRYHFPQTALPDEFKSAMMKVVEDIDHNDVHLTSERVIKQYARLKKELERDFKLENFFELLHKARLSKEAKERYHKAMQSVVKKNTPERYMLTPLPSFVFSGVEEVREYFTTKIKYLGPLREEPRALYPLDGNDSITDVELKGENTAAVFEANKNEEVEYISPENFCDGFSGASKTRATLSEAVNSWLEYLGVAQKMTTFDRGKMGHELKISTGQKGQTRDLTHVGVGVSQVLPILVMSLLAKRGDVLILEQPELHLHPRVQTRLADFFVTMELLDKQCLIETHSEYLINRLRFMVAKSDDTALADNTTLYFVEKDADMGYSKYRPVTINKYGVIEDWPDGFFDESEKMAVEILRAGMAKKQLEDDEYEE